MSHSIRRNLLFAWSILPFLSPAKKRALLARFTPPERILEASAAEIAGALSIRPHEAALVREPLNLPEVAALARAESADAIVLGDPDYPPLLAEIADPPLALFARGDRRLLSLPALAVVGSRRASTYGLAAARRIARELVRGGVAVVSGLARGIDGAAHRETLEAGGATLAVLGTGVDLAYPPEHRTLRDRILECGLVLSELPPGTPPRREHFPVRNRIIAGLAHGVVVVEAGAKSGSLITARLALEGGREVFAVPGSIFSQTSEGGHRLIQDGAKLLHSMDDLWNELPFRPPAAAAVAAGRTLEPHGEIAAIFPPDEGLTVDQAAEKLGMRIEVLAPRLFELEMRGRIRALPGARYVRLEE